MSFTQLVYMHPRATTVSALNVAGLTALLCCSTAYASRIRPVSDSASSPLTPPPSAFSIWLVIYVLLIATCAAQFFDGRIADRLSGWFLLSTAATLAWLHLYTRGHVLVSGAALFAATAFVSASYVRVQQWPSVSDEGWPLGLATVTFSLYLGWMLVATVLGISQAAHHKKWRSRGLDQMLLLILFTAVGIAAFVAKDPVVGVGLAWAALSKATLARDAASTTVLVMSLLLTAGAGWFWHASSHATT